MPTQTQLNKEDNRKNGPNLGEIRRVARKKHYVDAEALRVSRMPRGEVKTTLQHILDTKNRLQEEIDSLDAAYSLILAKGREQEDLARQLHRKIGANQASVAGIKRKTQASLKDAVSRINIGLIMKLNPDSPQIDEAIDSMAKHIQDTLLKVHSIKCSPEEGYEVAIAVLSGSIKDEATAVKGFVRSKK